MREIRDLNVSSKHHTIYKRSYNYFYSRQILISGNLLQKQIADISTAETSVSFATEAESSRSIMPTDDQALMALQDLLSDPVQPTSNDFQSKKSNSLQRKGEDKKDEAFQLIQKIHNQLQQVQFDLQKLHSLHKYEF